MQTERLDEETHTYWIGDAKADSPTGILREMGFIYPQSRIRKDGMDAFAVGKHAHKCLEYHAVGRLNWKTVHPKILGYVESGARWFDAHVKTVLGIEEKRFNAPYSLAGTIDLRCLTDISNSPMIIDYTISASAKWKVYQTGCYQFLAGIEHRRGCLALSEDGSLANWIPHNDPNDWQRFLGLVSACRTMRQNGVKEIYPNVN